MTGIVKVYDAEGQLVHDCKASGCTVSWDGYDLETGEPIEGRAELGPEWDTSTEGVARLVPPAE